MINLCNTLREKCSNLNSISYVPACLPLGDFILAIVRLAVIYTMFLLLGVVYVLQLYIVVIVVRKSFILHKVYFLLSRGVQAGTAAV